MHIDGFKECGYLCTYVYTVYMWFLFIIYIAETLDVMKYGVSITANTKVPLSVWHLLSVCILLIWAF